MSTELYRYTPRPGEWIAVHATGDAEESCQLRVGGNPGMPYETAASIPDAAVPEVARGIVRAMYEAIGEPPPIVLDQEPADSFGAWFEVSAGSVLLDPRGPMTLEDGRRFASALAAAIERAEREPDPAEVEALSRVILAEMYAGPEAAEGAARAILARYTLTEREAGR